VSEVTESMLIVVAKAFFKDCQGDEDYEFLSWEEQLAEFQQLLKTGGISEEFIKSVFEMNGGFDNEEYN